MSMELWWNDKFQGKNLNAVSETCLTTPFTTTNLHAGTEPRSVFSFVACFNEMPVGFLMSVSP
jgi:hypothetical protein